MRIRDAWPRATRAGHAAPWHGHARAERGAAAGFDGVAVTRYRMDG